MTTLKQVAERAGVSSATVSKVLSNTPYVSAETRNRVLEAIDALGYVPNLAARALAHGRTFNIGVIFPLIYTSLFSDPQMMLILGGVERVLTQHGYNMVISTPQMPVDESEQFQRLLRSRYLDGVILLENLPEQVMSSLIVQHGYPFVAIGYKSLAETPNTVRIDDYNGAYAAAQHLLDLGHRQFGIIDIAPYPFFSISERLRGYRAALADAGIDYDAMPRISGNYTIASGAEAMETFLHATPRPTALLSTTDLMAIGAINAARAAGLRVPEDLSVVGFDDIPLAAHMEPSLTTVRQASEALGETAASMLFDLLAKKKPAFDMRVLPTSLIVRGSTGPVSA
jgi:DNA-binding LacI/PurR family transcriptional regulator